MKNKALSVSAFTATLTILTAAILGLDLNVRADDDPSPTTQQPDQSTNQASGQLTNQPTMSGELSGVVVNLDPDKKLVKIVVWDPNKGDFKQNDAGRYQARTLKWSEDSIVEDEGDKKISEIAAGNGLPDIRSVTDLIGWKTGIVFDNDYISRISLVVLFSGESMAGLVGPNGFQFAAKPSGKLSAERTHELDEQSDSADK
jgi:hypothetical protein